MKRNLKQYMGMCLLLILSMVGGHTALAANTWKMAAIELDKNVQATLSLQLENSDAVNAFQFDLTLPAGLQLTKEPTLNENRISGHQLDWTALSANQYRCIVYSLSNENLEGNSGEVLSLPVFVNPSFAGGQVTLTNLVLTNKKAADLSVTTDMGLLSEKKISIQLLISGLTQKVSESKNAEITVTTIPADLEPKVTIQYDKDNRKTEGAYTVKVTRAEDAIYNKVDTTLRMVLVAKDQPVIKDVPTASALNEGQRLAQSILSGGSAIKENEKNAPVPGKFVWLNPDQVVTTSRNYTALFIPTDESRYANVEVLVEVTVNPVYHVSFLSQPGGSLKIAGEHADQTYVKGSQITIEAVTNPNYEFVKWIGFNGLVADSTKLVQEITVKDNLTITPVFERPKYKVNLPYTSDGTLTVTCDGETLRSGENSCAKGSTLLLQATPYNGYRLNQLTINGEAVTKYTVTGDTKITCTFTELQTDQYPITTAVSGEGTIRLFNEKGKAILPGTAMAKDSQFTVICVAEPGCELETLEVKGATLADGKYTLTGETTVTAKFKRSSYELIANQSGNGTLTITPQKSKYEYGDQITITASDEKDLYRLVVNGKAIKSGQVYTITGKTSVYAKFLVREELNPNFIKQDAQSYVYNNQYHRFEVNLSNIYAYWDFNVSYPGLAAGEQAPVNTGKYTVRITREEDQNYKAFQLDIPDGLEIRKAKMRVIKAPESKETNETEKLGKTSPAYAGTPDIQKVEGKTYLYKFTYKPVDTDNYEPVDYYYSTSNTKYALSVGSTPTLRSDATTAERGYVLVTNGNMVVTDLTQIPEETELTLQAIAAPGYRFNGWKAAEGGAIVSTQNPLPISMNAAQSYIPDFQRKAALNATLANGTIKAGIWPAITVTADEGLTAPEDFQMRFFADAGTQSIAPQEAQKVGTHYVKVYRAEDDQFEELNKLMSFTVIPAEIPSGKITWPTATAILAGETLAESQLIGGSADELEGTFTWSDSATAPTETGDQDVTFTPVDPNYNLATGKTSVTVHSTTTSTGETTDPSQPSNPGTPGTPEDPTAVEQTEDAVQITATKGLVHVDLAAPHSVRVIAMSGLTLFEQADVVGHMDIPVSNAGVYAVILHQGSKVILQKVIVR